MFQIKICGITSAEDALLAAELGADAIGLNFYEKSPRFLAHEQAKAIESALFKIDWRGDVAGVFVNADRQYIFRHVHTPIATIWQFHGDEPPEFIKSSLDDIQLLLKDKPATLDPWFVRLLNALSQYTPHKYQLKLVRAFRCRDTGLTEISNYLARCHALGCLPHAILLDAHAPGSYGGTGQKLDWNMVGGQRDKLLGLPVILAGGLTPDNVAQAILIARPDAVDVASGVESSPGKKDPAKLRDFITAAREAFATAARSGA
jgi:phosphoribosylanthranilate isomerase